MQTAKRPLDNGKIEFIPESDVWPHIEGKHPGHDDDMRSERMRNVQDPISASDRNGGMKKEEPLKQKRSVATQGENSPKCLTSKKPRKPINARHPVVINHTVVVLSKESKGERLKLFVAGATLAASLCKFAKDWWS